MISAIIRKFLPRNSSRFPDDENGDILYSIWQCEGDIDTVRTVNFSIIAPTELEAKKCAIALAQLGGTSEVNYFSEKKCWDILLSIQTTPSWKNITKIEQEIEKISKPFNCKNDGWGFYGN